MKCLPFLPILLLLTAAAARAQQPRPAAPADSTPAALVGALRSAHATNRLVRVRLTSGDSVLGRVGDVAEPVARVAAQPLRLALVERLDVRFTRKDPVTEGVAVGTVLGLALGYLGALFAASLSEGRTYTRGDALRAIAIGGGVGAVFGAVVDAGLEGDPQWRTVWRRPAADR